MESFSVALARIVVELALHGTVRRHLLRLHPVIFLLRIIDQQGADYFDFATPYAVDLLAFFEFVRYQILHRWQLLLARLDGLLSRAHRLTRPQYRKPGVLEVEHFGDRR